ncbi:helix-turn-helix transcriptional regulator [Martelella radicis]|uniref:LuxR family transcriptional regulator n=1 Tax=Martelella radicis TaxID=1397476 RepID=A0A7W6KJV9_9HYPH|nr:LuxR family transcriptional regulator [Martelella radicis]MBB4121235.1 LuxR family transcriptional regulator [Martelella radicis]
MQKYQDLLEYLVLIHEVDSLTSLYRSLDKVAHCYGLAPLGLFRRTVTPARDAIEWQSLLESGREAQLLFDGEADGLLLSTGVFGSHYFWDTAMAAGQRLNPALYRRLRTRCAKAAEAGLSHGVTFPVFAREGLAGALVLAREDRIELSPLEISLFGAVARETSRRCLAILQRGETQPGVLVSTPELSSRELTILKNLADGMTSVETGRAIGLTNHTVNWYVSGLQQKLGARNRQNLVALAFRLGLVS